MATPGLEEGFYEVSGNVFKRLWEHAIRSSGIIRYGKKLHTSYEDIGRVDLLITGAVAVSGLGERIGKGTGYFDWEYQILCEIGSVNETTPVVTVVHP